MNAFTPTEINDTLQDH